MNEKSLHVFVLGFWLSLVKAELLTEESSKFTPQETPNDTQTHHLKTVGSSLPC